MTLGDAGHALALRQILANESVGVFAGPPFPRVIGRGEVECRSGCSFDLVVAVELGFRCRMDLNFMASDFVMPHCTLTQREGKPITPAMAAGLESRVWSMLDVTRRMGRGLPDRRLIRHESKV